MVSQTFLDLSAMLLKERWDISYNEIEVQSTMEEYFNKKYDLGEVREAIGIIANNLANLYLDV